MYAAQTRAFESKDFWSEVTDGIEPRRAEMMRALAMSKGQAMDATELRSAMQQVVRDDDTLLADVIKQAILDGIVEVVGSNLSLTTIGRRAASALLRAR